MAREALRLRVRWVRELTARAAWELGRRLVDVGVVPSQAAVRLLTVDELTAAVQRRSVPEDLATRSEPTGRPLPARFRLAEDGAAVAAPAPGGRRRGAGQGGAIGAGGGVRSGAVHLDTPTSGGRLPTGASRAHQTGPLWVPAQRFGFTTPRVLR